jgi:hypothetical protein
MSQVVAAPEWIGATAADLESIGAELDAARAAAAGRTSALVPAGADEVSTAVTALFAGLLPGRTTTYANSATATPVKALASTK